MEKGDTYKIDHIFFRRESDDNPIDLGHPVIQVLCMHPGRTVWIYHQETLVEHVENYWLVGRDWNMAGL